MSEGTMQAAEGEKLSTALPSCKAWELQQWRDRQDIPQKYDTGTCILGATDDSYLIEPKSHSIRGIHAWYYKPSQEPMLGEGIEPIEEPTTTILIRW